MKRFKKKFQVLSLIFFAVILSLSIACPFDPEYGVETLIYNLRSETIEVCAKGRKSKSAEPLCSNLETGKKEHGLDPHLSSKKRVSELLNYLIIKDSNGAEILNLRGETLDAAFKVVEEDEYFITYRLDVN